jgi:hypothetical protein
VLPLLQPVLVGIKFLESGNTMAKAHPGFQNVAEGIAKKQGVSKERASAMLAAGTRRASAKAKKANPRLHRVKGGNDWAGPMKSAGLVEGRKHNLSAKEHFTEGGQNSANLSDKCMYERGQNRPSGIGGR